MGGLSKKASLLDKLRLDHNATSITVDGGGILFENASLSAAKTEQEKITAAGIVEAYNLMEYSAVGISRHDLAAGVDFLKELAQKSRFAWLSANLVSRKDRQPVFAASTKLDLPSFHIGVIGITGNDVIPQINGQNDLALLDWRETLPAIVNDMTSTCDFIILLSSLPAQENLEVARTIGNIHLIVQANGGADNRPPTQHKNTLITQTLSQGKYLGALYTNWQQGSLWQEGDPVAELANKRAERDRLDWQLGKIRQKGNPETMYRDDPERLASYREMEKRQKELAREINEAERTVAGDKEAGAAKTAFFRHSFTALETTMPDQPEVLAVVKKIKENISSIGSKTSSAAAGKISSPTDDPATLGYVGWQSCASCHQEQSAAWQKTGHFKAYQTLADKSQQFNLDCIACHVTAVVDGSEAYSLTLPEGLLAVGCEACHGPGAEHLKNPAAHKLTAMPEKPVCLRCHVPEHSDSFDYESRRKLVH